MIERIIALRGRGGVGKSTTIILLADELIRRGWLRESRTFHGNKFDITDVYVKDGKRLGVASAGDNFHEVDTALTILSNANCSTVICACRTRDMPDANQIVRGTHFAMRQFTQDITFVNKTIVDRSNTKAVERANEIDLNTLLTRMAP